MKTRHYLRIGLICSLILHVGIFAFGGYVMHNITKDLTNKSVTTKQDEDITYVDSRIIEEMPNDGVQVEDITTKEAINSDVVVAKEDLNIPEKVEEKSNKEVEKQEKQVPKISKPKFRTSKDTKILVKEIDKENLVLNFNDVKNSMDLMPTYEHKEKPIYDTKMIPSGEVVVIVVEYIMDEQGKVIQAYPIISAEKSNIGLTEKEYEDLNIACIQALEKYKIKPPKDKRGNIPQQEKFFLTHDGAVKRIE